MEENYLFGLLVLGFFGVVAFIKPEQKTSGVISKQEDSSFNKSSDVSGVAKYLQAKVEITLQSKSTGVEKYLQEKEALHSEKAENLVVSGVAKYLDAKKQASASGVTKYMAKQAVYAKEIAEKNASGVEKYLKSRG